MTASRDLESGGPSDSQNSKAPDISGSSGQTRLFIEPVKADVADIKSDIKAIKDYRHADQRYILTIYGAGFLLLATLILVVYSKLDDKVSSARDLGIKVDTKLEELIKRIPPAQTPPPKR